MIARVLTAALAAGFLAAVVASVLQAFTTTPLILRAEAFERQAATAAERTGLIAKAHLAHEHPAQAIDAGAEWRPAEGVPRAVFTGLATLLSGVGYALLLSALLLGAGSGFSLRETLPWAIGGFLAVNLAPAMGLPPELPGMGGGSLAARQAWWLAAALGTGLGLYLVGIVRARWAVALGLAAMVGPHVVGAPHAAAASGVPAVLAAQFAARSLAVAFVFWAVLGLALGWIWPRLEPKADPAL